MSTPHATGRFRLTNGDLLGVLLLGCIFIYLSGRPLWHTDIWAHAKYGEWYWTHAATPPVEPLSPYSDKTTPFANVAWLSQVIYYLLYQLGAWLAGGDAESRLRGGAEALRSFHLLLLIGRFTFLWLALRRFGGSAAWATVGVALYLFALRHEAAVQRPQAFGVFFLTVILYALSAPALSRRAMALLPALFLLWANLHGTFVVGLAVLGLHTVGRAIERGPFDREVRRLVIVGFLCALATLVNPHGPLLYKYVLGFSGHPNLKTMKEWWPMELADSGPYLMSLVLLVFVRVLGGRKVGAAGWLVALPFALWPWHQGRAILWWWTVAVWLLARLGPGLGDRFPTMPSFPEGQPSRGRAWLAIGVAGVCLLLFPPVRAAVLGTPRGNEDVASRGTPRRLALELSAGPADEGRWLPELRSVLRAQYPDGRFRGAIFASETQGDFLVWSLPEEMPVLMFTHAHVFTPEHWNACLDVKYADDDWAGFLDRHRTNLIVVEVASHPKLAEALRASPDWIVVRDEPPVVVARGVRVGQFIVLRKNPL
jgi:hypothetical protein